MIVQPTSGTALDALNHPEELIVSFKADSNAQAEVNMRFVVRDPANSLIVRYHFRDHLGTSSLTQSFRTVPEGISDTPSLTLTTNGNTWLPLFDHHVKAAYFEPFGDLLTELGAEEDNYNKSPR